MLRYRVAGRVDEPTFEELVGRGLCSGTGHGDWTELSFWFRCGCGDCPEVRGPTGLRRAQAEAEREMSRRGLSWRFLGEEMIG